MLLKSCKCVAQVTAKISVTDSYGDSCANGLAYQRADGIHVVPLTVLGAKYFIVRVAVRRIERKATTSSRRAGLR